MNITFLRNEFTTLEESIFGLSRNSAIKCRSSILSAISWHFDFGVEVYPRNTLIKRGRLDNRGKLLSIYAQFNNLLGQLLIYSKNNLRDAISALQSTVLVMSGLNTFSTLSTSGHPSVKLANINGKIRIMC
eukprot:NODE_203_length_14950_cov_0.414450.p9 type:complete len:131 gc:universal NODE_203_length_14950_cov_0.414450:1065-1457(+)